jgi:hypothetical protein
LVISIYAFLQLRVPRVLDIFITVFTTVTLVFSLLAYYLSTDTASKSDETFWATIRKILETYSHIFWFFVVPITILLKIVRRKTRPMLFFLVAATLIGGALAAGHQPTPVAIAQEKIRGSTGPNESASALAILMWVLAAMVCIWGGVLAIKEGRWDSDSQTVGDVSPSSIPTSSWIISFLLLFWIILWLVLGRQHQSFIFRV